MFIYAFQYFLSYWLFYFLAMASNYDSSDELIAELKCCICQDNYDDPISLSCGHNFCRQCILSVFNTCNDDGRVNSQAALSCPVCREVHFISANTLSNMPVNLKLRNIVAAVDNRIKLQPAKCATHNKPFVLFCFDCKEAKCLTCFITSCSSSSHDTKEIDELTAKIRSQIDEKLLEFSESSKPEHLTELELLTDKRLSCAVEKIKNYCKEKVLENKKVCYFV